MLPLSANSTTFLEISTTSSFATAVLLISTGVQNNNSLQWDFFFTQIQTMYITCIVVWRERKNKPETTWILGQYFVPKIDILYLTYVLAEIGFVYNKLTHFQ